MGSHRLGMADNGSEISDNNANVKTFLDIETVKILPLECYRGVDWLLEYLCTMSARSSTWLFGKSSTSSKLSFLCIACECDLSLLKTPIKLFRLRTEVLHNVA